MQIDKILVDYVRGIIIIYYDYKVVADDFTNFEELIRKIEGYNKNAKFEVINETNS